MCRFSGACRLGVFDVFNGIDLLREGLDLPEVSLVAILDADKEGFLRSAGALIQTIGRAATTTFAVVPSSTPTPRIRSAIDETEHRRRSGGRSVQPPNMASPGVDREEHRRRVSEHYERDCVTVPKRPDDVSIPGVVPSSTRSSPRSRTARISSSRRSGIRDRLRRLRNPIWLRPEQGAGKWRAVARTWLKRAFLNTRSI